MVLFFLLVILLFRSPSDNLKCCQVFPSRGGAQGGDRCRRESRCSWPCLRWEKSTVHCIGCLGRSTHKTGLAGESTVSGGSPPAPCLLGAVAQDSLLGRCDWGTGSLHGRKTTCVRFLCFLRTVCSQRSRCRRLTAPGTLPAPLSASSVGPDFRERNHSPNERQPTDGENTSTNHTSDRGLISQKGIREGRRGWKEQRDGGVAGREAAPRPRWVYCSLSFFKCFLFISESHHRLENITLEIQGYFVAECTEQIFQILCSFSISPAAPPLTARPWCSRERVTAGLPNRGQSPAGITTTPVSPGTFRESQQHGRPLVPGKFINVLGKWGQWTESTKEQQGNWMLTRYLGGPVSTCCRSSRRGQPAPS